ncbi:MAG TPA: uracil-DNA glycosylase [Halanaerobiales bacterium]|nr:uracil-DNA glycosylase [Halanaerobiales bacterium]
MNWREQLNSTNTEEIKRYGQLKTWYPYLKDEFTKPYMRRISAKIANYKQNEGLLCPSKGNIFRAFRKCPYEAVKLVILGQDPYPGKGIADGLVFSTKNKETPKSLKNIFKELTNDFPDIRLLSNSLDNWAEQGALLINTVFTTHAGISKAHINYGWEILTNKILELLNNHNNSIVFMLWGNDARKYKSKITNKKHLILEAVHPSPLSANRGFFGCNHFKKAYNFIKDKYNYDFDFSTK